mmetsp:Transcript_45184/g.104709  ORF Transcript_45184/g.104709 Transcript_45184/m.104709 type:complete len:729 (-) Transcript_45184:68-2254(-)
MSVTISAGRPPTPSRLTRAALGDITNNTVRGCVRKGSTCSELDSLLEPRRKSLERSRTCVVDRQQSTDLAAASNSGRLREKKTAGQVPHSLQVNSIQQWAWGGQVVPPKGSPLGRRRSCAGLTSTLLEEANSAVVVRPPLPRQETPRRAAGAKLQLRQSGSSEPSSRPAGVRQEAATSGGRAQQGGWPQEAWHAWAKETGGAEASFPSSFEQFRSCRGVKDICTAFAALLHAALAVRGDSGDASMHEGCKMPLDLLNTAGAQQLRYARTLVERLEARRTAPEYTDSPLEGHRAVVVGAGPVGLRCALELRLLGAEVIVLERRTDFERINRLHLWPWCAEDLKGWGAKILEPPELSFGADADFLHIGIGELQMLLLKVALLLGVQVFFGVEFDGCSFGKTNKGSGWIVSSRVVDTPVPAPGPPLEERRLCNVSIVVGADGARGGVAKAQGLAIQEMSSLRKDAALGLVANFVNTQSKSEKRRRSFALARQFYGELFAKCEAETGVELENIVYYVAPQTHYFVMTPTLRSLQALGVLAEEQAEGSVLSSIDQSRLECVARAVASFNWKSEEPSLPESTLEFFANRPALFDFSSIRRAAAGFTILKAPKSAELMVGGGLNEASQPKELLMGLCGDALIEPFWPEGLGIVRGFFGAMDLAFAAKVWASSGDAAAAANTFEASYRQLKSLAAKTRETVLRLASQLYTIDPATRYRGFGLDTRRARSNSLPAMR